MKKNSIWVVLFAILMVAVVVSCKKKQEKTVDEIVAEMRKPQFDVTQADTAEVMSLVDHYLQQLRDKQIEDAVAML